MFSYIAIVIKWFMYMHKLTPFPMGERRNNRMPPATIIYDHPWFM